MEEQVKKSVDGLFPNLNRSVAYYDPLVQLVGLERMSLARFNEVMKNPQKEGNEDDASIIAHEFRHCVDHLGTLWGQKYLLKLQKAIDAVLSNDPNLINYIIDYKYGENIAFNNFMDSAVLGGAVTQSPKESLHIGLEISEDKINPVNSSGYSLKIIVYSSSKEFLFSMPITMTALLEVNAMNEEIIFKMMTYDYLYKDDSVIYARLYENDMMKMNQNFDLNIYNSISNITATLIGVRDWPITYLISSHIATLTLNLPDDLIKRIPITEDKNNLDPTKARMLLDCHDYGFIYYTLCKNYGKLFETKIGNMYSLKALLEANNLPPEEELSSIIIENFNKIKAEIVELRFKERFLMYNRIGLSIINSSGIDSSKGNVFGKLSEAGWFPPYRWIDEGPKFNEVFLSNIEFLEKDLRNASAWFTFIKTVDNKMNNIYKKSIK